MNLRRYLGAAFAAVLVFLAAGIAQAQTIVTAPQNISTNTTWTAANSPYLIQGTGDVTVDSSVTLTVDPGVIIKFVSGTGLYVDGTLSAVGTSGSPIIFTSILDDVGGDDGMDGATVGAAGDWNFITANTATLTLEEAFVSYGGGTTVPCATCANIVLDGGASTSTVATLTNTVVSDSSNSGIVAVDFTNLSITGGSVSDTGSHGVDLRSTTVTLAGIDGTSFGDHGDYAISGVELADVAGLANLTFSNSTLPAGESLGIRILGGNLDSDWTMRDWGAAWVVGADVNLRTGNFVMDPGVIVKFDGNYEWAYDVVTVDINGASGNEVIFTSIHDDVGGDTNGNGNATTPAAGDYNRVRFNDLGDGSLLTATVDWTIFRYGGSNTLGGVYVQDAEAFVTFEECTFEDSAAAGLYLTAGSGTLTDKQVVVNNSRVRDNAGHGIHTQNAAGRISVQGTEFGANGGWSVFELHINELVRMGRQPTGDTDFSDVNTFTNAPTRSAYYVYPSTTAQLSGSWGNDAPIVFSGSSSYPSDPIANRTIDVEAGAILKFDAGASITMTDVDMTLDGTMLAPIMVTSLLDDSTEAGGDVDGVAGSPAKGDWDWISFDDNNDSRTATFTARHTTFRYGGRSASVTAMWRGVGEATRAIFEDCTFVDSQTSGIRIQAQVGTGAAKDYIVRDTTFQDNDISGINCVTGNGRLSVQGSTFVDNGSWDVNNMNADRLVFMGRLPSTDPDSGTEAPNSFSTTGTDPVGIELYTSTFTQSGTWGNDTVIVVGGGILAQNNGNLSLTVEENTVFKFSGNYDFTFRDVDASFNGTMGNPIVFTSLDDDTARGDTAGDGATTGSAGQWSSFYINDTTDNTLQTVSFDFTEFRFGGSSGTGMVVGRDEETHAEFRDCRFENSGTSGFYVQNQVGNGGAKDYVFERSVFANNAHSGIRASGITGRISVQGSTFDGNGSWPMENFHVDRLNFIGRLPTGDTDYSAPNTYLNTAGRPTGIEINASTLTLSGIWTNDATIVFAGNIDTANPGNLDVDVQAGTVIKMGTNIQAFLREGTYDFLGTSGSPIIITSLADDSAGGDTAGDGATSGSPGDWTIFYLNDSTGTEQGTYNFDWTEFRYGGGNGNVTMVWGLDSETHVEMRDCTIMESASSGVRMEAQPGGGSAKDYIFERTTFVGNGNAGIQSQGTTGRVSVQGCTFDGNDGWPMANLHIDRVNFIGRLPAGDMDYQAPNSYINTTGRPNGIEFNASTLTLSGVWSNDAPLVFGGNIDTANPGNLDVDIQAGTIIKMGTNIQAFLREGTYDFAGTMGNPIVVTSIQDDSVGGDTNGNGPTTGSPGDWTIFYLNDSTGTEQGTYTFDWTEFRYGGGNGNVTMVWGQDSETHVEMRDSTIMESASSGLRMDGQPGSGTAKDYIFERTTFVDNGNAGIQSQGTTGRLSVQGCTFDGNDGWPMANLHIDRVNFIGRLPAGDMDFQAPNTYLNTTGRPNGIEFNASTLTISGVWTNDAPLVFGGNIDTTNPGNLDVDIQAGTVIKMSANVQAFFREGTYDFAGTMANPIVVTSIQDDSVGGDTNGNGPTTGSPGDWTIWYFNDSGGVEQGTYNVDWTEFRYGGGNGNVTNLWAYDEETTINFRDSIVRDSASAGFRIEGHATTLTNKRVRIERSTFQRNGDAGVWCVSGACRLSVQGSTFEDNVTWPIRRLNVTSLVWMGRLPAGDTDYTAPNTFINTIGAPHAIQVHPTTAYVDGVWGNDIPIVLNGASAMADAAGVSLAVEPGTIVKFDSAASFQARDGTFDINGGATPGQEVVFTSLADDSVGGDTGGDGATTGAPGQWGTFYFNDGSGAETTSGTWSNVIFRYGGSFGVGNVYVNDTENELSCTNCEFRDSSTEGLRIDGTLGSRGDVRTSFVDSIFADNGTYGIRNQTTGYYQVTNSEFGESGNNAVNGLYMDQVDGFTNNTFSAVNKRYAAYGIRSSALSVDQTWTDQGAAYLFTSSGSVNNGVTLTLDPNVVVKLASGQALTMNGNLSSVGTSGQPITITSYRDDTALGDTDGLGSGAGTPGQDFAYVLFQSTGTSDVRFTNVRHGGNGSLGNFWISGGGATVTLEDCISENGFHGLDVRSGAVLTATRVRVRNNQSHGVNVTDTARFEGIDLIAEDNRGLSINGLDARDAQLLASPTFINVVGRPGVGIRATTVTTPVSFPAFTVPYLLQGGVNLSGGDLSIDPGAVIKVGPGAFIQVNAGSSLLADARGAPQIVFTSQADDTLLGDTDGVVAAPVAGDYTTAVYGFNNMVLGNVRFSYGTTALVEGVGTASLDEAVFSDNTTGFSCTGGTFSMARSVVSNNGTGVSLSCNGSLIGGSLAARNTFTGNTTVAVTKTAAPDVNARFNYWGSRSGPFHPTLNPNGTGDTVGNNVDFGGDFDDCSDGSEECEFVTTTADAGADFSVEESQQGALDGSGSFDPESAPLSYAWTQLSGTSVSLSDMSAESPTFTAPALDVDEDLVFQLIVDTVGPPAVTSTPDTVTVTVVPVNDPPVVDAGSPFNVRRTELAQLQANATDVNLDEIIAYEWTQLSGPGVSLSNADEADAFFTAPNVSTQEQVVLQVRAQDEEGAWSAPDTVTVTIDALDASWTVTSVVEDLAGADYVTGPEAVIGETITVNGTGLTAISSVQVGETFAESPSISDSSITFAIPPGSRRGSMRLRLNGVPVPEGDAITVLELVLVNSAFSSSGELFNADGLGSLGTVNLSATAAWVKHPVVIAPSGRIALAGRGVANNAPEFISKFDFVTGTQLGTIPLTPTTGILGALEFVGEDRAIGVDSCQGIVWDVDIAAESLTGSQVLGDGNFGEDMAVVPGHDLVAVANRDSTVTFVDISTVGTPAVAGTVDLGALTPTNGGGTDTVSLVVTQDGRWVLAANAASDNVSVIEILSPTSFSTVGTPLTVGENPRSMDISGDGTLAVVYNDGAEGDSLTLIDLTGAMPAILGTEDIGINVTADQGTNNGCPLGGATTSNSTMVAVSYEADRILLAEGNGVAGQLFEVLVPPDFPTSNLSLQPTITVAVPNNGVGIQPARVTDEVAPALVSVDLVDGDGLIALGPGDYVEFTYSEFVSSGVVTSALQTAGSFATLVAQLGGFDSGDLAATAATLSATNETIRITLGGAVSGDLQAGGDFTPAVGSVDDVVGNLLTDTTPVTVGGGFMSNFEPIFVATDFQDNQHVRATFDRAMTGGATVGCWTVSSGGVPLGLSDVTRVSSTVYEITLSSNTFVGATYDVLPCAQVVDAANGLTVNLAGSTDSFVARDLTPPVFGGLTAAVDAGPTDGLDDAVRLSWTEAIDNFSTDIDYVVYYSVAALDPLSSPTIPIPIVSNTSTALIQGLTPGQGYRFVVRARDEDLNEETNTVEQSATPSDGRPPDWVNDPVVGITNAVDTNEGGRVEVFFGPATDRKSEPVTYNVYVDTALGTLFDGAPNVTAPAGSSSAVVSGLTNDTLYFFGVRAEDAAGNVDSNTEFASATPGFDNVPPTFAGIDTATDDGTDGRVILTWLAATETDSPPIAYNVYWSTDMGMVFDPASLRQGGLAGLTFVQDNLSNGTPYFFGVRAVDGVGNEDPNSVILSATPTFDSQPPVFAGIDSAIATGIDGAVDVAWLAATEDKSLPITYDIFYDTVQANVFVGAPEIANVNGSFLSRRVSGLPAGVEHFFGVRVKDSRGNVDTNTQTLSATPQLDTAPPVFSGIQNAVPGASGAVDLTWASVTDALSNPVRYNVYVETSANVASLYDSVFANVSFGTQSCASGANAQFCVDGLQNDVEYVFAVRAVDAAGNEDGNTTQQNATPVDVDPPVISNVVVTPTTAGGGDILEVSFRVSESLAALPQVDVTVDTMMPATEVPATLSQESGFDYVFTYAVTGTVEEEGTFPIEIRAVDLSSNAGSATTMVTFDFTQDLEVPAVVFVSPGENDEINDTLPDIEVRLIDSLDEADPFSSGIDTASIQLFLDNVLVFSGGAAVMDGTGWEPIGTRQGIVRYRPTTPLAEGFHTLGARVVDGAGNDSGVVDTTFNVVPPDELVINPSTARLAVGQTQLFTVSWNNPVDNCTWRDGDAAGGTVDNPMGASATYTPTGAAGDYVLKFTCPDPMGGPDITAQATVTILNLLSIDPPVAILAQAGQQVFTAQSDLSSPDYSWTLEPGAGSLTVDPMNSGQITLQAGTSVGQYDVTVRDNTNDVTATALVNIVPGDNPIGRAIVVAGGSIVDHLWDDSRELTQFAYQVLESRGYRDDTIYFMTQGGNLDFDLDGDVEVDAFASTNAVDGLEYAVTTWAAEEAGKPLFLYLVDHGGTGSLWIGDDNNDGIADPGEILQATDLDAWLDTLGPDQPVVLFYEACKSGTFIQTLAGPNRVILTSAGAENAIIALDGTISFSQYFFAEIARGVSAGQAFDSASAAMAAISPQIPRLEDDSDGIPNGPFDGDVADATFIGFPFASGADVVEILTASASPAEGTPPLGVGELGRLDAVVVSPATVTDVYALVVSPSYVPPDISEQFETPELDLPRVDLFPDSVDPNLYVAALANLDEIGTYRFLVYASDSDGRTAAPRQATIEVINRPPALVGLVPADGAQGVRIDTSIEFTLSDEVDGVDFGATQVLINGVDVTSDLVTGGSSSEQNVVYPVDATNEFPEATTIQLEIRAADLATPSAAVVYQTEFETAGGLRTENHMPARFATSVPVDPTISVDVVDDSGFGIAPATLRMEINGVAVPALVRERDPVNDPGSLEAFELIYLPLIPFGLGEAVEVTVRASDTAGHAMTPDTYFLFIEDGTTSGDTTAPMVASTSPADGNTGVAPSANITFVLTDGGTVDFGSISAEVITSATTTTYLNASTRLTCSPDPALGAGQVTCVLDPIGNFVRGDAVGVTLNAGDAAGNAMAPFVFGFVVESEDEAPSIVSRVPGPSALHVPIDQLGTFHVVDVSSGVDLSSISMTLNSVDPAPMITGTPADYLVTYEPSGGFAYSTNYSVSVTAQDESTPPNVANSAWTFRTDTGMRVVSTLPAQQSQGVPVTASIEVRLTDLAAPAATFDLSTLTMFVDSTQVAPVVGGTATDPVMTYQPSVPFGFGAPVTVVVFASDTNGHAMPSFVLRFTTVPDTAPPVVSALAPAPLAQGVSTDASVSFEIIDTESGVAPLALTVDVGAFRYCNDPDDMCDGAVDLAPIADGFAATVVPVVPFVSGDVIPVVVNARDTAGNAITQIAYTFTVGDENVPPTVAFLSPVCPEGGTTGVAVNAPVVVEMLDDGAGIDVSSIVFRRDAGVLPSGDYVLSGDSQELMLRSEFVHGLGQTVSYDLSVSDLSADGNPVGPVSSTFTTTDGVDGADADGMPTDFENCYFTNGTAALPEEDADADGANNLQEYLDGTNPRDPNDVESVSPDVYDLRPDGTGGADDIVASATPIVPGSGTQIHNFHQAGDPDWLTFDAVAGRTYRIATSGLQGRADTLLVLFDSTGLNTLGFSNDVGLGDKSSEVVFEVPDTATDLTFTVRVTPAEPDGFGAFTQYRVGVFEDSEPPSVTNVSPADGDTLAIVLPTFSATVEDDNSGVDPATVRVLVDGDECAGSVFNQLDGSLTCTPTSPLDVGGHVWTVEAADLAGNLASRDTVFTITDFAVAPSSFSVVEGSTPITLTATGGVDPLDWTAGGGTLAVAMDGRSADFSPGNVAGDFTVVVTDANGRQSTARAEVTSRLAIAPAFVSVGPTESVDLSAVFQGGSPTFQWSVSGGGTLDAASGPNVVFTSGADAGTFDVTLTETGTGATATGVINILSTNVGYAVILASTAGLDGEEALAVRNNAEQAYRAMIRRGFNRDRIFFLTGDTGAAFDGDGNGLLDDIDGELTKGSVLDVFTSQLPPLLSSATPLVVYAVGGNSTSNALGLNASESLTYVELRTLLGDLEQGPGTRNTTILLDTNNAGSAVEDLSAIGRIVMSSTSDGEKAIHDVGGQLSFSFAFFNRVFLGESIGDSFSIARGTLQLFGSDATARIDDDGDGLPDQKSDGALAAVTFIGEPGLANISAPIITDRTADVLLTTGTTQALFAEVLSTELVDSVSVTILPPFTSGEDPVTLAMTEVVPQSRYELTYADFASSGVYRIVYSARDIRGRTSVPVESTVTTPGPYVSGFYPAPDMSGIPINSKLYFTGEDAFEDIDVLTGSVLVDGMPVACQFRCPRTDPGCLTPENPQRVDFECDHPSTGNWMPGQVVGVSITVQNSLGVSSTPFAFNFSVTNEVDGDSDGLPDDFQAILGERSAPSDDADSDTVLNSDEFAQGLHPIEIFPPDAFEDDDDAATATAFDFFASDTVQRHNFHDTGDEDWVSFTCRELTYYEVSTDNLEPAADTVIDFVFTDGRTVLDSNDDFGLTSRASRAFVACVTPGTYYVRVRPFDPEVVGPQTGYDLDIFETIAGLGGLYGSVTDAITGGPVLNAEITVDVITDTVTDVPYPDGDYLINLNPGGPYTAIVQADGYLPVTIENIQISNNDFAFEPVVLQPDLVLGDTDGDGIPDAWETARGLNPNDPSDALLDPDGDGWNNLQEYLNNTDPQVNNAPSAPTISSPPDGSTAGLLPELRVFNATDPDSAFLVYFFSLFRSDDLTTPLQESIGINQMPGETAWRVEEGLEDAVQYTWSAYASDGFFDGPPVSATFTAQAGAQEPLAPTPFLPLDGSTVVTLQPTLTVGNGFDIDGDLQDHTFEVYEDIARQNVVATSTPVPVDPAVARTSWTIDVPLTDGLTYFWSAKARDATGAESEYFSPPASFTVDTTNTLPEAPTFIEPAMDGQVYAENPPTFIVQGQVQDADGDPVTYRFFVDRDQSFGSPLRVESQDIVPDAMGVATFTPRLTLSFQPEWWVYVVANDGVSTGPGIERSFQVTDVDTLPGPVVVGPTNLENVARDGLSLVVEEVQDPLGRTLTYEFELYDTLDFAGADPIEGAQGIVGDTGLASWAPESELERFTVYAWRARAVTDQGTTGEWSTVALFIVTEGGQAPSGCHCDGAGGQAPIWLLMFVGAGIIARRRRKGMANS